MVGVKPKSSRTIRRNDQRPPVGELEAEAAVEDIVGVVNVQRYGDEAQGLGQLAKVHAAIVYTSPAEL